MAEKSDLEKTEEPTPHRLRKAREEGKIPRSRDLTTLFILLSGWAVLSLAGTDLVDSLSHIMHQAFFFDSGLIHDPSLMLRQCHAFLVTMISGILPFILVILLVSMLAPNLVGGLIFATKTLTLDLKKINPLNGLKRLFSLQTWFEMLKTMLKTSLIAWSGYLLIYKNWYDMTSLTDEYPIDAMSRALAIISECTLVMIISLIPVIVYDVFYQLTHYTKKMRMSRQEIRDEFKQHEGDPHIKARIKQLQRRFSRQRMMSNVIKADVIVTNPVHYAVALKYEESVMKAPILLAKGRGEVAARIKQIGENHQIPILSSPPLARALYRYGKIDKAIPVALYNAVAEVLAWVYGLRRWRKQGGLAPRKPTQLSIPPAMRFTPESNDP